MIKYIQIVLLGKQALKPGFFCSGGVSPMVFWLERNYQQNPAACKPLNKYTATVLTFISCSFVAEVIYTGDSFQAICPGCEDPGGTGKVKNQKAKARKVISDFKYHLSEGCIGSVSEIFDADEPHHPRGCIAQA